MAKEVKQGEVISSIFLSLDIDPLLDRLRMSGFGCHIIGVYIWVLYYKLMTSQLCVRVLGGLNEMLKICYNFAQSNSIIFNQKKRLYQVW